MPSFFCSSGRAENLTATANGMFQAVVAVVVGGTRCEKILEAARLDRCLEHHLALLDFHHVVGRFLFEQISSGLGLRV